MADGHSTTDRIAAAAGLSDRPHIVDRALRVLESLELIGRERNFGASVRTPWHNRVADNGVRFWYRFVHKNRSLLETGEPVRVWERRVNPHLDTYMGKVFEGIVREAYARHHEGWGLGAALDWARWEGQDRNRRPIEVDLVAELDDGRLLTGEVKWSSRPVDHDLHLQLRRNLEDLARAGQGWAHRALDPRQSAGRLQLTRSVPPAGSQLRKVQRRCGEARRSLLVSANARLSPRTRCPYDAHLSRLDQGKSTNMPNAEVAHHLPQKEVRADLSRVEVVGEGHGAQPDTFG